MKPKSKLPIAPKHSPLGSPQKHAEAPTHADHRHESLPGESGERRWEQRNHVPRPEAIISLRFRRGIREGLHQTSPPPHPTPSRCRLVALGCPALAAPGHWVSSEAFVWPPFDPPLTTGFYSLPSSTLLAVVAVDEGEFGTRACQPHRRRSTRLILPDPSGSISSTLFLKVRFHTWAASFVSF